MSSGMNFELYTKGQFDGVKFDSVIAQFPHYAIMRIALDSFIQVFGENLYARAITEDGQAILGRLSHKAKYIVASPSSWPVSG